VTDAVVLSQGDEVVTGQITDTNAAWLSERLTALGLRVVRHVTVGDRLEHIASAFGEAIGHAHVVLCTGGLGPTADDLTAAAVASVTGRPLQLDAEALAALQARYASFGRAMPESNRKQAMLPEGATRIDNARGTAPGFAMSLGGTWLACMPGVPHEMRAMFDHFVEPALVDRLALRPSRLVVLRTVGLGESTIQDRIQGIAEPGIVLATRTLLAENQLKLRIGPDVAEDRVRDLVHRLREAIGRAVFAVDGLEGEPGGALVDRVAALLTARGQTLSVAESCTGGQLAAACTARPGASEWFMQGVVTYANAAKTDRLGVSPDLIATHGAVSEPVARAMAEGIRRTAHTTWGLATTGIAGPSGGSPDKPVGTVHVAAAGPTGTTHRLLRLPGDRARIQGWSVAATLELLRRQLLADAPSLPSPRPGDAPAQPPRS